MKVFLDSLKAELPLTGSETKVSLLFCGRGSYQRGGFAPWPLFECRWSGAWGSVSLFHNKTNQIKASLGQINLDTTPFSDITVWRRYLIVLERSGADNAGIAVSVDDVCIWRTEVPVSSPEPPVLHLSHPYGEKGPHAVFRYILLAGDVSLEGVPQNELASLFGFDPLREVAFDEAMLAFEPLPEASGTWTYSGDKYPFHRFPDGRLGLDPGCLPFSKNGVVHPVAEERRTKGGEIPSRCPEDFDALVDPENAGDVRPGVFSTISGALESLHDGKGRIFIKRGIYTEKLVISGDDIVLVGEDPFTTVIVGYEARTNGIARNALVHYTGAGEGRCGSFSAGNLAFYNKGAEWNESIGHPEKRGAALFVENIRGGHFSNCLFLGQQDTLYLKNGTMRFDECYIEGHIDYICGGASAFFSLCHLHSLLNPQGYIAAIAPLNECGEKEREGLPSGFTFHRCLITCDPAQTVPLHLGRGPWINGSGLDGVCKYRRPSICTFTECTLGTADIPFLLDRATPWQDMDRSCKGELYRENGNSLNGGCL